MPQSVESMNPPLLTRKQVAALLACSDDYLLRLADRGEGPPVIRLGRAVRYAASDVHEFIREQRAKQTAKGGRRG